jgi:hypothetical protein
MARRRDDIQRLIANAPTRETVKARSPISPLRPKSGRPARHSLPDSDDALAGSEVQDSF